jgi:hypothetical protein
MRNARGRIFRKPIDVSKEMVAQVEAQILDILNVSLLFCAALPPGIFWIFWKIISLYLEQIF